MKLFSITLLSLFLFSSSVVFSQNNYEWLDETPGEYFTKQDWDIFKRNMKKSLNTNSNINWKNNSTGSEGTFRPIKTMKKGKNLCRVLNIKNSANHRKGESTLTFCKINGEWKGI